MKRFRNLVVFSPLSVIGLFLLGTLPVLAETPVAPPETIILISLDTTRADRLSCYGYEHETTPNIDALAKESLFFEHPFAPVPITLPSHSSMFTGLLPPTHGVHLNTDNKLPASALTLPEILKQHGFTTYGIVSAVVLRADLGLSQGFDHYDDEINRGVGDANRGALVHERNGKETTDRALQWLSDNADKKKFMFIHYFDPHADYKPPAPFDTRFKDPYDGEIAFTDYCVGQILDRLKALGLYENALIALVGDHGEMLGEHGEGTHAYFIYQNALRVPMMFKPPGATQSRRIKDPSSLIDVTPTLLSMAGLAVPEAMQGVDLSSYFRPGFALPDRAIYAESMTPTFYNCSGLLGIVMGRWHYIQSIRPELYDRLEDPAEMNNLIAQHPAQASKMKDRLKRILSEAKRSDVDTSVDLDAETLAQLESLGYVDGDATVDYSFEEGKNEGKDDAKDLIGVHNQIFEAKRMARIGRSNLAIKSCTNIIQRHPKVPRAYIVLADFHFKLKEYDKAIDVLQRLLELFPVDRRGLLRLLDNYVVLEEYTKSIDILDRILALKVDDAKAYDSLIEIYIKQNAFHKALDAVQRRRKVLLDDPKTLYTLGKIYQRLDDAPNALTSFLDMLALNPNSIPALVSTAATYFKMGDLRQALSYYEQVLAQNANRADIHRMVARLKTTKGDSQLFDPPSALTHAERSLQICNDSAEGLCDDPTVFDLLSIVWAFNNNFDEAIAAAARAMELYELKGNPAQAERMKRLIGEFTKQRG